MTGARGTHVPTTDAAWPDSDLPPRPALSAGRDPEGTDSVDVNKFRADHQARETLRSTPGPEDAVNVTNRSPSTPSTPRIPPSGLQVS